MNWADGGCYEEHPFNIKNLLVYPFSVKNTVPIGDYLARYFAMLLQIK